MAPRRRSMLPEASGSAGNSTSMCPQPDGLHAASLGQPSLGAADESRRNYTDVISGAGNVSGTTGTVETTRNTEVLHMTRESRQGVSNEADIAPADPKSVESDSNEPVEAGTGATEPAATKRSPQGLTKVSANFVKRSMLALEVASQLTGDNQTDVLNRSVQVYAYLMKVMNEGKLVFVEDPTTGVKERLVLL